MATRLQSEWNRLYRCGPAADPASGDPGLIDAEGRVRALVGRVGWGPVPLYRPPALCAL